MAEAMEEPVDRFEELKRRASEGNDDDDIFTLETKDDDISIVLNETDPDQSPFWPHEDRELSDPTNPYPTTETNIVTKSENVAKGVILYKVLRGFSTEAGENSRNLFRHTMLQKGVRPRIRGVYQKDDRFINGLSYKNVDIIVNKRGKGFVISDQFKKEPSLEARDTKKGRE